MATSPTNEKGDVLGIESAPLPREDVDVVDLKVNALKEGQEVQLKSEFDNLTTFQAISKLRKTVFIAAISGFCAATDGMSINL